MGIIGDILGVIFGGGRNTIAETVEVFRPNAEAQATRDASREAAALAQFAAEFAVQRQGFFDRFMDGLNRLPRPMLALGTLGLFVAAMADPVWFAPRMQGIALVPEPLWWLMGAIVSFYFGARHQTKTQDFQKGLSATLARTPQIAKNIRALEALQSGATPDAEAEVIAAPNAPINEDIGYDEHENAALDEWRAKS
ncbi:MAG: holin family protein [Paracoccaceae bacterium]